MAHTGNASRTQPALRAGRPGWTQDDWDPRDGKGLPVYVFVSEVEGEARPPPVIMQVSTGIFGIATANRMALPCGRDQTCAPASPQIHV